MEELQKYTPEEEEFEIPCRIWLPSEHRAILVDLVNLPYEAMTIDVIAHSLATKARYNGQTPFPYFVSSHSILVSLLLTEGPDAPPELKFEALMHDASETYVGDMIHPIKRKLPDFKEIENIVERQIRQFYHLPARETPDVKTADIRALWLEQHFLQGKAFTREAMLDLSGRDLDVGDHMTRKEYSWGTARDMFLIAYRQCLSTISS